jgi:hypothetical protein
MRLKKSLAVSSDQVVMVKIAANAMDMKATSVKKMVNLP